MDYSAFINDFNVPEGKTAFFHMGQAGFILKDGRGYTAAFDIYLSDLCEREFGFKRLIPPPVDAEKIRLDAVIATHGHYDHFDALSMNALLKGGAKLFTTAGGAKERDKFGIVADTVLMELGGKYKAGGFEIEGVFCDHGALAPDALGLMITSNGKTVYMAGDTALRLDEAEKLKGRRIDIMFVPINGAFGNLNEEEAAELTGYLEPDLTVPCHYGMFKEHGGDVLLFESLLKKRYPKQKYRILQPGDCILY